jgi:hypothetical protein
MACQLRKKKPLSWTIVWSDRGAVTVRDGAKKCIKAQHVKDVRSADWLDLRGIFNHN